MPEHKTLKDGTILAKTSYADLIADTISYDDGTLAAVLTATNIKSIFIKETTGWKLLSELPIVSDSFPPPEYENRLLVYKNKAIFNSIAQSSVVIWKLISQTPDSVSAIPVANGEFIGELRLNTVSGILYQWDSTAWSVLSGYTNENAQDAVASALVSGIHTGIEFLYGSAQDNANRIDAKLKLDGNGIFGFWNGELRRITLGDNLSLNTATYTLNASGGSGGNVTTQSLRYETQQYLSRINTTGFSGSKIAALNKFIDNLINAGIYQKWDCVYIDTGIPDNIRQNVIRDAFGLIGGNLTSPNNNGVTEATSGLIESAYQPIVGNSDTVSKFRLFSSSFAMYLTELDTANNSGVYFGVNGTRLYNIVSPTPATASLINQLATSNGVNQVISVSNANYSRPAMIQGSRDGISVGMLARTVRFSPANYIVPNVPNGTFGMKSNGVFRFLALGSLFTNGEQEFLRTSFNTYLTEFFI